MGEGSLARAFEAALFRSAPERFGIAISPALDRALARALEGPHPAEELADLLRLVVALERSLESPSAAQAIRDRLRRSWGAIDLIRKKLIVDRAHEIRQGFAALEGARPSLRAAPAPCPVGSIPLTRFLDPITRRPNGGHHGC